MSYHDDDDELLEYQTETDDDPAPVLPVDPVPVRVCEPVVTIETVPQHVTMITHVVQITASDPDRAIRQLLPLDPLRVRAIVQVHDQPAVLCHSRNQAQSADNIVAATPAPQGVWVEAAAGVPSYPLVIHGGSEMWVAATSATATRVSVIVERRTS